MPTDPLIPVRLADVNGAGHVAWALGQRFSLPHSFLQTTGLAEHRDSAGDLRIPEGWQGALAEATEGLRRRAAFTELPPASARLPFSYQRLPSWTRSLFAAALGRWQRRRVNSWASFPGWPLDLSADLLDDLVRGQAPGPRRSTPVLLTHDLDSPEGLDRLVRQFLPLEEAARARSVNFIVPCAWPIDFALLREVKDRGHEVGTHGYDHSNRTAFADAAERRQRLAHGRAALADFEPRGYRAPSLLRTAGLLRDLGELYRYDSSVPTSGGPFPVPNNGCASARPFQLEGITEVPLSLPRDGSLRFLGHTPGEIARLWIDCAGQIACSGGVVVLLTHCEARFSGSAAMLAAYREFLKHVTASGRYHFATADQVLTECIDDAAAKDQE